MTVSTAPATDAESRVAARDFAVVCDLAPVSVIAVGGADADSFLHGQLSVDVAGLERGRCRYATLNSPKGRMLANFVLWRESAADGGLRMLVASDIAANVLKRLAMYRLRAKVTLTDVSNETIRLGIGGPNGARVLEAALGSVPEVFSQSRCLSSAVLSLPGPRYVVLTPVANADETRARFEGRATVAPFDVWQWLTIRAGVPVITAATQDSFIAQTANLDLLGGIDFNKGCYTGQEIIARMQYLGRLKERAFLFHVERLHVSPGERIYSSAFGDQPCGTVINAALAPEGGSDLLAVMQVAAVERSDARLGGIEGPLLSAITLPYAIPVADKARGGSSERAT